jgi:hypothetical protein
LAIVAPSAAAAAVGGVFAEVVAATPAPEGAGAVDCFDGDFRGAAVLVAAVLVGAVFVAFVAALAVFAGAAALVPATLLGAAAFAGAAFAGAAFADAVAVAGAALATVLLGVTVLLAVFAVDFAAFAGAAVLLDTAFFAGTGVLAGVAFAAAASPGANAAGLADPRFAAVTALTAGSFAFAPVTGFPPVAEFTRCAAADRLRPALLVAPAVGPVPARLAMAPPDAKWARDAAPRTPEGGKNTECTRVRQTCHTLYCRFSP